MTHDDLTVRVTPGMRASYLCQRLLGKMLSFRGAERTLATISDMIGWMQRGVRGERDLKQSIRLLAEDGAQPALQFGSGYGYHDPLLEVYYAAYYRAEIQSGQLETRRTESGALYRHMFELLSRLLESDPAITHVVDFGVLYAHIGSLIAARFPGVAVYGIDRSEPTKRYNDAVFDLPNLHVVAGDIFDFLSQHQGQGGVFLTTRTMVLLPPSVVMRVYQEAARSGFRYIVGGEHCGISWQTGQPYRFSDEDQPSVILRNKMFIHNYPGLLRKVGFVVRERTLLKTNHLDRTLRLLCFTARRDDMR